MMILVFRNRGAQAGTSLIHPHSQAIATGMVPENPSFLAFVPYAAEVPFEIWILPKQHQASFGQISDESKLDLAVSLRDILGRLHLRLKNPDYNYIIVTSPQYKADEPQLHWYLQIRPRLTTRAGFEIGSGISINPSLPEADADFLNKVE
jgi:UDPglucose--hexose-1-phosphate uridylyltransferase